MGHKRYEKLAQLRSSISLEIGREFILCFCSCRTQPPSTGTPPRPNRPPPPTATPTRRHPAPPTGRRTAGGWPSPRPSSPLPRPSTNAVIIWTASRPRARPSKGAGRGGSGSRHAYSQGRGACPSSSGSLSHLSAYQVKVALFVACTVSGEETLTSSLKLFFRKVAENNGLGN